MMDSRAFEQRAHRVSQPERRSTAKTDFFSAGLKACSTRRRSFHPASVERAENSSGHPPLDILLPSAVGSFHATMHGTYSQIGSSELVVALLLKGGVPAAIN
jgi:hypothetical protein